MEEKNIKIITGSDFSGVGAFEFMVTDEIFIDARYHYGFTNILDDNPAGLEAKNTNIQIGIGVKI